jgi:hypothetical protein
LRSSSFSPGPPPYQVNRWYQAVVRAAVVVVGLDVDLVGDHQAGR